MSRRIEDEEGPPMVGLIGVAILLVLGLVLLFWPRDCRDGQPDLLSGECRHDSHRLVVRDGVALCVCEAAK